MREGNRDVGRERVPHLSQLTGHSRSADTKILSLKL